MTPPKPPNGEISKPAKEAPTVSVVIPAYTMDRWSLTKKAVESARRQTSPVEAVILCIDNNPELLQSAEEEWDDEPGIAVRVLANRYDDHLAGRELHQQAHGETRRFGAGSARNTAAEVVTSDIIAFMDDDAWAEPDWIHELRALYEDSSIMAVGGAPLPEFETTRPAWYPRNFDWVFGCAYDGLPTSNAPTGRLIGANMSVRQTALNAVGGFLGSDFDDLNLCLRLASTYGPESIYYAPGAIVHHYVPERRVTWSYFWRRCYFVNRQKVHMSRQIGSAASLEAELSFVLRAVRTQAAADVKRWLHREDGAFRSLLAMFAGMGLAAVGRVRGQLDRPR